MFGRIGFPRRLSLLLVFCHLKAYVHVFFFSTCVVEVFLCFTMDIPAVKTGGCNTGDPLVPQDAGARRASYEYTTCEISLVGPVYPSLQHCPCVSRPKRKPSFSLPTFESMSCKSRVTKPMNILLSFDHSRSQHLLQMNINNVSWEPFAHVANSSSSPHSK